MRFSGTHALLEETNMSITIDLPPAIVQEAKAFAESRHTTFEQVLLNGLESEMKRIRNETNWKARFDKLVEETSRRRDAPYRFNRADAYD